MYLDPFLAASRYQGTAYQSGCACNEYPQTDVFTKVPELATADAFFRSLLTRWLHPGRQARSISRLPGGPGRRSTRNPTACMARRTLPFAA